MTSLPPLPFAPGLRVVPASGPVLDLATVEEARRFVERERLPVVRSGIHWLDVHKRLLLAQATRREADVEAARAALAEALRRDAGGRLTLAA
ncbi:hypothetical protein M446_1037 [Methylobacterium sp. 4-46]|uniref:hypothetical protein n=1 Tax=unclassified Methylobacterium TaxID=2615210 RepID=UPI000165C687|nr:MULTISPECIES: hypothetical protein [Methylobacterium]ACA15568.1 hypothetical protein M446_1037 [Methylobacterium sp. 4-46]WFT81280.1 hypothetical protein QA634_05135 [Methylobacterium nodulans]